MNLVKAQLIIDEDKNKLLEVLFNPQEYSITTNAEIIDKKGIDIKNKIIYQNTGVINETFTTKLVIDEASLKALGGKQKTIKEYVNELEVLIDRNYNPDEPIPKCKFVWGDLTFEGVLTSLSKKYTMFSENGIPLRANLDIKIENTFKIPDESAAGNPTFDIIIEKINIKSKKVMVESVVVDTSIEKADSFHFKVSNAYDHENSSYKWVDDFFVPGKAIEIKMGYDYENKTVFEGFITLVSFDYSGKGETTVTVSGMDASIKMMIGINSFSWEKKKYSDVVRELAGKYSLSQIIDSTEIEYEKVEQYRKTNYQFIRDLATQCNFEFFIKGKKLYFRKPHTNKNDVIKLDMRRDSVSFEINQDIANQVDSVVVRGWDVKKKEEFEEKAQNVKKIGNGKTGSSFVRDLVGSDTTLYIYSTEDSRESANNKAQLILDSIAMKLVTGKGEWIGSAEIIAGKYAQLKGAGQNLDKLYYIISSKHTIKENGYSTSFELRGNDI